MSHDRFDEALRLSALQRRPRCPPDSFVKQLADHDLLVEQYIPLNQWIEVMSESHRGERLGQKARPHPAYPAGIHDLLYQLNGLMRGLGDP